MQMHIASKLSGFQIKTITLQLVRMIKMFRNAYFLPLNGQISSNTSYLSVSKSIFHVPCLYKDSSAFQKQKPAK